MQGSLSEAVAYGLRLALEYNPLLAVIGAASAAALLAPRDRSVDRVVWGVSALVITWLVGDGLRVIARARDLYDGAGGPTTVEGGWVALAVWAACGLFVGYVLPAWAGAFVGRRVTHGTGWIAAASIAVAASLALSAIVGSVPRIIG